MSNTIKVRAKSDGGVAEVKCLITHPMEQGNRKDKTTGQDIEPHFIQDVTIEINGKVVVSGAFSGAISKNPYLACRVKANPGDTLKVTWVDNKGDKDSVEDQVK
ncbi:MAG: thiosulfate oxidation carrier complex protein SoxZ [Gammaproteobacteria bacterium RIFOXYA12_FULL_61_12]|nr:MAG: thiosulfate oxidation carrier complex protein SoxZ [Gammaproteobacteria bacterium RIFOXYD12_FULL_61_37]OGT91330.1 MAG: thiosulfate oxidation carrier complex protein SoxZ [Gammaproteobacteria bacterium RIFOXYA12_FULL_61_12]